MIKLMYALFVTIITVILSVALFSSISYVATGDFFEFPKALCFATIIIFAPFYYSIDVFIKTAITKHFYLKCLREIDCLRELAYWKQTWNSSHWCDLYSVANAFSRMPKKKYYGEYDHRIDDYNLLVKDTCFILAHLYQDRYYINKLINTNFNENLGELYTNDFFEKDYIIKRRWKFFLDKMSECEEKEELKISYNEKFNEKYGIVYREVPNHLNKDFL